MNLHAYIYKIYFSEAIIARNYFNELFYNANGTREEARLNHSIRSLFIIHNFSAFVKFHSLCLLLLINNLNGPCFCVYFVYIYFCGIPSIFSYYFACISD